MFSFPKIGFLRILPLAALLALGVPAWAGQHGEEEAAEEGVSLETEAQQMGYAWGVHMGRQFRMAEAELDLKAFEAGYRDALADRELRISDQEISGLMRRLGQQMRERAQIEQQAARERAMAERQQALGENLEKARAFLEENRGKEGVTATASGLQYMVLEPGDPDGAKPTARDTVRVHYHGTLLDGTVFDSSVERGQPLEFALSGVIRGWTEGLQLMPVGSKYRFWIPPNLAYGEQAMGRIPPNSLLVFDVELLEIK